MEDPSSVPLNFAETKALLERVYQENCSADKAEFVTKDYSLNALATSGELFFVQKTSKIVTSDKDSSCTVLYTLSEDGKLANTGCVLPVDPSTIARKTSPCGKHKAVIKSNGDNNFILELYTNSFLIYRKEVKDKWKAFATSGYLVSYPILWSSDSSRFLFMFELFTAPKVPKPTDNFEEAFLTNHQYKHNL